jgi:FG-GAP repeat
MTCKPDSRPASPRGLKPKLLPQAIRAHLATTAAVCLTVGTTPLTHAFDSLVDVSTLDGSNGFRLINSRVGARPGPYVGGAGDINGDGIDDLIVGSPGDANNDPSGSYNASGRAYVLFGQTSGFNSEIDLNLVGSGSTLPEATPGFRIVGDTSSDIGVAVSAAGDINGDTIDDLIISAPFINTTWVVFGKTTGFGSSLNVSDLEGGAGFRLNGETGFFSGFSISNAGDVNNDTYDDIIIGQDELREGGGGKAYVVFGGPGLDAATTVDLTSLDGTDGFCIHGQTNLVSDDTYFSGAWPVPSAFGASVSGAGDVNGDGFDDVIVGAPYDLPGYNPNLPALINPYYGGYGSGSYYFPWNAYKGSAYVVFGATSFSPCTQPIIATNISGAAGFRINGVVFSDALGASVSGAGDINADGTDDLIVGAPGYVPLDDTVPRGRALVIFGSTGLNSVSEPLRYKDGFNITANDKLQFTGLSVSDAGDVDGDGIEDIIVGSPGPAAGLGDLAGAPGYAQTAKSHVVFGQTTLQNTRLTAIDNSAGADGFRVGDLTDTRLGYAVHSAGDINGDGLDDIITGAPRVTNPAVTGPYAPYTDGGNDVSYVVLGEKENLCTAPPTTLTGGEWKMVGVPCDPGAANSLADVFGPSLGVGNYQATWVAYTWDNSTVTPAYRALTLADTLNAGDGLWLYSTVSAPLRVNSQTQNDTAPTAAASSFGIYQVQLENPPISDLEASVFNLVGFPTANPNRFSASPWSQGETLFETALGGYYGYTQSYDLDQTVDLDGIGTHSSTYWIWNAGNLNYDTYSPTVPGFLPPGEIEAYDAIWVETFCCYNTTYNVGFILPLSP